MIFAKEIYEAIRVKLKELPALKNTKYWFDWNLGQFNRQKNPPVDFPGILLNILSAKPSQAGRGKQIFDVRGRITIAFKVRSKAHSAADQTEVEHALNHLDIIQGIYELVGNIETEHVSTITPGEFQQNTTSAYRVYYFYFTCAAYSNYKNQTTIINTPIPNINTNLNNS